MAVKGEVWESGEKAYERVPRKDLWYCIRKSGLSEKYVRVVQELYKDRVTAVKCEVGTTDWFKVKVGLHQGSAMSLFLFAGVMDRLTDEVRQVSPWTMMFADNIVVRVVSSLRRASRGGGGAPQGCVLSPLLFTLLTHGCRQMHSSNHIIKFADDTTVVGLISKNDESAYREEVQRLTAWCGANNLSLNVDKMKEMVVDFRRVQSDQSPLIIDGSFVEIVKSTKFLGVHLADNLTWSLNTSSITKKALQRLYFLRRLKKAHLPSPILTMFYRGTIESILNSCITAWFGNCTGSQDPTEDSEDSLEDHRSLSPLYHGHLHYTLNPQSTHSIVDDHTHPSHTLFTLLPSGKWFRSIWAITTRLCNSFFPQAISLLNTQN
ncbi:gastrula zinc finger protein XlCGF28.1-like [Silurus asotus]|uniref:Gastrula zinc finger protein XlCGF28.1-like n=1 Tax=Silurus asotus TaxID=30991 RepID=A0AAD5ADZ3_SILAS|nr:gastrula zinc finger protein XlCGF28.1-like [Silurus asotus]